MRGRRTRTSVGFRPTEAEPVRTVRTGGSLFVFAAISALVVSLALLSSLKGDERAAGASAARSILMTLGDTDRPADWDAFFARHPLPDDAIRSRIRDANEAAPGDVVCVPLEAEAADTACL